MNINPIDDRALSSMKTTMNNSSCDIINNNNNNNTNYEEADAMKRTMKQWELNNQDFDHEQMYDNQWKTD